MCNGMKSRLPDDHHTGTKTHRSFVTFKVLMFQCNKHNSDTQILNLGDFCNILVGFCNIPAHIFLFHIHIDRGTEGQ